MSNLAQAIRVETLKARRSRMSWLTALATALLPLAGGFFMIILRNPELARQVGLISAKAQLTMGAADWPNYLRFLSLGAAAAGIVISGFVVSWVFGREYADRTIKDLLALPTPRAQIVVGKFAVIAVWAIVLVAVICLGGLVIGAAVGLPPASTPLIWQGELTVALTGVLTIMLVTPIAFFASAGRGYLAPMGIVMLIIFLAQVIAILGWGEYCPWSIPGVLAQGAELGGASYLIVFLTGLAGIAATLLWWERADQAH